MSEELTQINKTLEKIESKIEDKHFPSWSRLIDYTKIQEEERKKREEERNEELLKVQKIQTDSIKRQEKFSSIVAFTGSIIALVAIYNFIVGNLSFENHPSNLLTIKLIFLFLLLICIGPLVKIVIDFWKKEIFRK